jgi:hypothetical protein
MPRARPAPTPPKAQTQSKISNRLQRPSGLIGLLALVIVPKDVDQGFFVGDGGRSAATSSS